MIPIPLHTLLERRWSLPVLSELHRTRGAKFVTLVARTGASRKAIRDTLAALIKLGLVMRNPGYGHPLRPEYLLTTRALQSGPRFQALHDTLAAQGVLDAALKKWSLPVLGLVSRAQGGARFSELRTALDITDRALTLALKDLQRMNLITRLVLDAYPPTTLYQATGHAAPIIAALEALLGDFPCPPVGAERVGGSRRRSALG
jgi:DNA-binding HxlR family transcriptional regulator